LTNRVEELPRKLLVNDNIFLPKFEIVQVCKEVFMKIVDDEAFSLASFDSLCDIQLTLDNIHTQLNRCKKECSIAKKAVVKVHTVIDYTSSPNEELMQGNLKRFKDFQV
jgi:hypothetical protein